MAGEGLRRRLSDAEVRISPFVQIDSLFFFALRVLPLFHVMTFFYQRGRGSTFRGQWIIPSEIGRGRWRISHMWRLVLPFKWKIGGGRWHGSRRWGLVLPFKWTYSPNTGPRERLSTLNLWQGMEGRIRSSGESIRQYLSNKSSPRDGIRGIQLPIPSRLGEDMWIWAPKLGYPGRPNCSL